MTPFEIAHVPFEQHSIAGWAQQNPRHRNWPVVYLLDGIQTASNSVYVGETINVASRMRQHLDGPKKSAGLHSVRVVIHDEFNKSACLDLESHLIRWLAGDGRLTVLNGNEGITDAQYFNRDLYRESFADIFEALRNRGVFQRTIPEIENSDLFKLSPFKSLTHDQGIALEEILESLLNDLGKQATETTSVIQGQPGTGKTIIAIYLMKLIADIRDHDDDDGVDPDSMFAEFFTPENRERLRDFRMGLVIPQQSLRESVTQVFKKTPKIHTSMVLTPWDVGGSTERFDLLIVDEAHRLNLRANQASGPMNVRYGAINDALFGEDDVRLTQLDWIMRQSDHRLLLLDPEQSIRPADLAPETITDLVRRAKRDHRLFPLTTQMRVQAGADYVGFIRSLLRGQGVTRPSLGKYDLRLFDDIGEMRRAIRDMDAKHGLSRMIAGFAWDWVSKRDKSLYDIELGGERMRWNGTAIDWINSPGSLDEVGSIHTVQGYDLNYAGVIIGPDLRLDPVTGRIYADRDSYRDKKGKENNPKLGKIYDDEDLLVFIRNVYGVLLTRGMLGTFIYVCDPGLREWLRSHITG